MLKELKFVQGAVAKKDFLPAMTHFVIEDGVVRSYNGMIALSSPIPFDINCKPKAAQLVKAISLCEDTIAMSMTPAGKLKIQSGTFKSFIECITEETAHVLPEGDFVQDFNGELLLKAFTVLLNFVGDDASRPWTNGILLKGCSAYATNNVIAVEYWLGVAVPFEVNIPAPCVKELLRIKEAPLQVQIAKDSITFHYSDGRWVRSQLFSTDWPPISKILDKPSNPVPMDERVFTALTYLKPFTDKTGRIYINGDVITTSQTDNEEGANYEVQGLNAQGIYQVDMLNCLKGTVTSMDWSLYPAPCLFFGESLRGAIIGMKL